MEKQKYILNIKVEVSSYQTLQFEVEGENKEEAFTNFLTKDPRRDLIRSVDVKYPSQVWESIQTTQLSRWADEDFQDVSVITKITDVEEVSSSVATITTNDGYTFHILENGKVVDNLDPKERDMTWPDIHRFTKALGAFTLRANS